MVDNIKKDIPSTPMLFPYDPQEYWERMRKLIQEEIRQLQKSAPVPVVHEVPGLTYKPLYKMDEVCAIFKITRPTIYEWVKHQKLKPYKIRSRVYFLWNDIQQLLGVH